MQFGPVRNTGNLLCICTCSWGHTVRAVVLATILNKAQQNRTRRASDSGISPLQWPATFVLPFTCCTILGLVMRLASTRTWQHTECPVFALTTLSMHKTYRRGFLTSCKRSTLPLWWGSDSPRACRSARSASRFVMLSAVGYCLLLSSLYLHGMTSSLPSSCTCWLGRSCRRSQRLFS